MVFKQDTVPISVKLDYVLVEAAGIEPASENIPLQRLHTYPLF